MRRLPLALVLAGCAQSLGQLAPFPCAADGCPSGFVCVIVSDGGGVCEVGEGVADSGEPICPSSAIDALANEGQSCSESSQCASGFVCYTPASACVQQCATSNDCISPFEFCDNGYCLLNEGCALGAPCGASQLDAGDGQCLPIVVGTTTYNVCVEYGTIPDDQPCPLFRCGLGACSQGSFCASYYDGGSACLPTTLGQTCASGDEAVPAQIGPFNYCAPTCISGNPTDTCPENLICSSFTYQDAGYTACMP